jgi:hypothetical protein
MDQEKKKRKGRKSKQNCLAGWVKLGTRRIYWKKDLYEVKPTVGFD